MLQYETKFTMGDGETLMTSTRNRSRVQFSKMAEELFPKQLQAVLLEAGKFRVAAHKGKPS